MNRKNRKGRTRNRRGRKNQSSVIQSRKAPIATTQIITNKGVLRELRVKHRELVKDIEIPETSGVLETLEVNPGLEVTFPWLSQIAQRFESYYFHSLKFHWVSAVPTTTAGSIAICPDYDAADDNSLSSKAELLSFEDAVRGTWWSNFTMTSTRRNLRKFKTHYIRGQALAANLDIKTYDVMQLILHKSSDTLVEGGGELWVDYDVQLITPQRKHEGDALQLKRFTTKVTISSPGGVGAIDFSDYTSEHMDVSTQTLGTPKNQLGIRTPGIYAVDLFSASDAEDPILAAGQLTINDTYRDGVWNKITQVYESVSQIFNSNGTLSVSEHSNYDMSYLRLLLDNITVAAGNSHNFWLTLTELLPSSPFRALHEVEVQRLKKLEEQRDNTELLEMLKQAKVRFTSKEEFERALRLARTLE